MKPTTPVIWWKLANHWIKEAETYRYKSHFCFPENRRKYRALMRDAAMQFRQYTRLHDALCF